MLLPIYYEIVEMSCFGVWDDFLLRHDQKLPISEVNSLIPHQVLTRH